MANGIDELRFLGEETLDFLKLRWASLRLGTVDRLSSAAAKALGAVVALVIVFFAVVFLMVALALWIGEMLGTPALGFLIAGGAFLLAGVVMFFAGRRMFANSMVRYFVDLFFTDNDYKHGMRS